MFFCFNNELSECNESNCRSQWTQAFTESNEFGNDTHHVYVGRFVTFVERLRSLSCLVYSLHLLNSLFNNIALQWKICHFQAKHATSCSAPFHFRHHPTHGRWVSISMPLPANLHAFALQSPCDWKAVLGFSSTRWTSDSCLRNARYPTAIPCVRDEKNFEVESIFLIYIS